MNPRALGWDIHRKFSKVSLMEMTAEGEIHAVERARLEHHDKEAMREWLSRLDPEIPVALEATFGWPWVADLLEEMGHAVHLGHPPVIRALAKYEAKTDRCDGDRLGKFQLRGILPESYLAPPEVRQRRERTRYRMALVVLRTGVKNRIQALLHRFGILHTFSDLFGKAGRRFLEDLALPEASRQVLKGYLDVLDVLALLIHEVEQWMQANLEVDEIVRLLMSIPGIGLILAHVIRSEIGQIERFPTVRHLASYDGLAPMSNDTAGREGPRHCSLACNHILRWALIEAAGGVQKTKGTRGLRLRKLYARLTAGGKGPKGCKSKAKVAVARELSDLVYVVWKKRVPYTDNAPPRPGSRDGQPTHQESPTAKTTLRPDQPRHPMVRRRPQAVDQTRL
jgi:transposase